MAGRRLQLNACRHLTRLKDIQATLLASGTGDRTGHGFVFDWQQGDPGVMSFVPASSIDEGVETAVRNALDVHGLTHLKWIAKPPALPGTKAAQLANATNQLIRHHRTLGPAGFAAAMKAHGVSETDVSGIEDCTAPKTNLKPSAGDWILRWCRNEAQSVQVHGVSCGPLADTSCADGLVGMHRHGRRQETRRQGRCTTIMKAHAKRGGRGRPSCSKTVRERGRDPHVSHASVQSAASTSRHFAKSASINSF